MKALRKESVLNQSLHSTGNSKRFNKAYDAPSIPDARKNIIRRVFEHYTSFGERSNLKHLRSNKFIRMARDLAFPVDKVSLDILFA